MKRGKAKRSTISIPYTHTQITGKMTKSKKAPVWCRQKFPSIQEHRVLTVIVH